MFTNAGSGNNPSNVCLPLCGLYGTSASRGLTRSSRYRQTKLPQGAYSARPDVAGTHRSASLSAINIQMLPRNEHRADD